MQKYIVKEAEIEEMDGLPKQHFLNPNAQRINKSLGDMTGLTGLGFHIIEILPGKESTEHHRHHHEDECVYVLSGSGKATIGEEQFDISEGDFIGYRAGGLAHTILNTGASHLKCIVVGQRLKQDVADYPNQGKRIYRNEGMEWDLVNVDSITHPNAGRKV